MINLSDYFGKFSSSPDLTDERRENAMRLIVACSNLESLAKIDGIRFPDNSATKTGVSGSVYGGFRPQDCSIGAAHSAHKEGLAVDRYDPTGEIDKWCLLNSGKDGKLEQCGIYIEHPSKTRGWSHWSIKAPASGHRVFYP